MRAVETMPATSLKICSAWKSIKNQSRTSISAGEKQCERAWREHPSAGARSTAAWEAAGGLSSTVKVTPQQNDVAPTPFLLFASSVRAHGLEEIRSQLEEDVPEEIEKITKAFENSLQSPLREQLHAAQHEMLLDHDRWLAKIKC
jgi:hypothetical protein